MKWHTVTPFLKQVLIALMSEPLFHPFRLVGGTSLSLQWGHRKSVDIDLFTESKYGSIDFEAIHMWLRSRFNYVDAHQVRDFGVGTSFFVGFSPEELVKLDIYYTDPFIRPAVEEQGIRMASAEDIMAMKLDIFGRGGEMGGRKKDFWDVHAAIGIFSLSQMLGFYRDRYPYGHEIDQLRSGLLDFSRADDDLDPVCLMGKYWELIKLDMMHWLESIE